MFDYWKIYYQPHRQQTVNDEFLDENPQDVTNDYISACDFLYVYGLDL